MQGLFVTTARSTVACRITSLPPPGYPVTAAVFRAAKKKQHIYRKLYKVTTVKVRGSIKERNILHSMYEAT